MNLLHLLHPHYIMITYISKNVSIIFLHSPQRPGRELIWTPGSQSSNLRAPLAPLSKQSSAEGGYRWAGLSVTGPPAVSRTQGPFN